MRINLISVKDNEISTVGKNLFLFTIILSSYPTVNQKGEYLLRKWDSPFTIPNPCDGCMVDCFSSFYLFASSRRSASFIDSSEKPGMDSYFSFLKMNKTTARTYPQMTTRSDHDYNKTERMQSCFGRAFLWSILYPNDLNFSQLGYDLSSWVLWTSPS